MDDTIRTSAWSGSRRRQILAGLKEGMRSRLRGSGEIDGVIERLIRDTIADTLRGTEATVSASQAVVSAVVYGLLQATEEVGTGLAWSTKSLTKGVVMGVGDRRGDVLPLAYHAVKGVVAGAAQRGEAVAMVASRAVQGGLEATQETGGNMDVATTAAVTGAMEAASVLRHTAVRTVSAALMGIVGGARNLLDARLAHPSVQRFPLDGSLREHGLRHWYVTAAVGGTAVVALPSYDCQEVRLLRQTHDQVHWWPRGEAGVSMPLEDAVLRLQLLHQELHM